MLCAIAPRSTSTHVRSTELTRPPPRLASTPRFARDSVALATDQREEQCSRVRGRAAGMSEATTPSPGPERGGARVDEGAGGGGTERVGAAGDERGDGAREDVAGAGRGEAGVALGGDEHVAARSGDDRRRSLEQHDGVRGVGEPAGGVDPVGAGPVTAQPLELAVVRREDRRRVADADAVGAERAAARRRRRRPARSPRRRARRTSAAPRWPRPGPTTTAPEALGAGEDVVGPPVLGELRADDLDRRRRAAAGARPATTGARSRRRRGPRPSPPARARRSCPASPRRSTPPTATCARRRAGREPRRRHRRPRRGGLALPLTSRPMSATRTSPARLRPGSNRRPGLRAAKVVVAVGATGRPPRLAGEAVDARGDVGREHGRVHRDRGRRTRRGTRCRRRRR